MAFGASQVKVIVSAITPEDRIHINLRPFLSAKFPQYGETIAWAIKVIANANPE